ncbi:MAG: dihydrofolate reductase family protein [Mariprofundus sp.]|nr:dihydrofolate reductase family protein [Mariprofundus sp.]
MTDILSLFPHSQQRHALNGLYLALNLHRQAAKSELLIYANYIASIDGRIALRDVSSGEFMLPSSLANRRDWRLYQELAAQADVMLTSARYFRQLAKGKAQDLLPVGTGEAYADLAEWRQKQGMKPQPDVVIISNSLDIPAQALAHITDRKILIFTSQQADEKQVAHFESLDVTVIMAGQQRVEGKLLQAQLIEQGYRSAYMIAGPEVHRTLIQAGVLNRLFLTTRLNLLAGDAFHTILNGQLDHPPELELLSLYWDQHTSSPQLFAQYAL